MTELQQIRSEDPKLPPEHSGCVQRFAVSLHLQQSVTGLFSCMVRRTCMCIENPCSVVHTTGDEVLAIG